MANERMGKRGACLCLLLGVALGIPLCSRSGPKAQRRHPAGHQRALTVADGGRIMVLSKQRNLIA